MSVTINHYLKSHRLSIGTNLDDLERPNSPYFAFFFTEFDRFSGRLYTLSQKKTSPTFLAITRESIDGFL